MSAAALVTQTCPPSWGPLRAGPAGPGADAAVSVFAGGNFSASGSAIGAEGLVVTLGSASIAGAAPGTYEVGTTVVGSQVAPAAGDDMLLVGGDLTGGPDTVLSVGAGAATGSATGGAVAVGGTIAPGTVLDAHGGPVDGGISDAVAPYAGVRDQIASLSAGYAAFAATGSVDSSGSSLVLQGDGSSLVQVFDLDTSTLPATPDGAGRTLQLLGVPDGAAVVVNLVGAAVDLRIDAVEDAAGVALDPGRDQLFADLSTHLLWNAPDASSVQVSGLAQVPGSLLVPAVASTTTLAGAGTNGRVWVAGDLSQTAVQLHSYPFLPDAALSCVAPSLHLGALSVRVVLNDPDDVLGERRLFRGTMSCRLDGQDVTPADDTWSARAGDGPSLLSDQLPVGSVCTIEENLGPAPDQDHLWDDEILRPSSDLQVARRQVLGFTVVNRVLAAPRPGPTATPTPSPSPSASATSSPTPTTTTPAPTAVPTPSATAVPSPSRTPSAKPSSSATPAPVPSSSPSSSAQAPSPSSDATATAGRDGGDGDDGDSVTSDPPTPGLKALTAQGAPLSLSGAVVWGPLVLLSLMVVLLIKTRPRTWRRRPSRSPSR